MLRALVTAGPTREKLDPVRYLSNFSSGKQGVAIAEALSKCGFEVTLVLGPCTIDISDAIRVVHIESAAEMLAACEQALPVDVAICAAAVSDWRPEVCHEQKRKKVNSQETLDVRFVKNPDILKILSSHAQRPALVVGFAAETERLECNAQEKLKSKGCNWIIANNVSGGQIFGSDTTDVVLLSIFGKEMLGRMEKQQFAQILAQKITSYLVDA